MDTGCGERIDGPFLDPVQTTTAYRSYLFIDDLRAGIADLNLLVHCSHQFTAADIPRREKAFMYHRRRWGDSWLCIGRQNNGAVLIDRSVDT